MTSQFPLQQEFLFGSVESKNLYIFSKQAQNFQAPYTSVLNHVQ